MNPKQTAYTDQQGGTVGLLSRLGIMIGREQLVNSQNQAENTDRSRFQRKEVGIRTDEQDIEEEGLHRLFPYQHQYIVRTMQ